LVAPSGFLNACWQLHRQRVGHDLRRQFLAGADHITVQLVVVGFPKGDGDLSGGALVDLVVALGPPRQ
jgi:hypothetical protein